MISTGTGRSQIATGIGFLDHMLDLLARHSRVDIVVKAKGDLHIDHHHTTEDVGIALGQAVKQALGDMKGITRYADVHVPMDEALTRVAIDISGRPFLVFKAEFVRDKVGTFDTELVQEWFQAFATNSGITLHAETLYGTNDHHIASPASRAWRGPCGRRLRSIHAPKMKCRQRKARSAGESAAFVVVELRTSDAHLHGARTASCGKAKQRALRSVSCSCATAFISGHSY